MFNDEIYHLMGDNALPLVLVGYSSDGTTNPTVPAHQGGDLIINVASTGSSTTVPTATGAGNVWLSESHSTQNAAIVAYQLVAVTSSNPVSWTGASGVRAVWVFRNAAIDTIQISQGTGTTLDYDDLTGMTASSLVGLYYLSRGAQTAVSAAQPVSPALTQRTARNTSVAAWTGDSNTTLLSSFAPANTTFDTTTSGWMALDFSVKQT